MSSRDSIDAQRFETLSRISAWRSRASTSRRRSAVSPAPSGAVVAFFLARPFRPLAFTFSAVSYCIATQALPLLAQDANGLLEMRHLISVRALLVVYFTLIFAASPIQGVSEGLCGFAQRRDLAFRFGNRRLDVPLGLEPLAVKLVAQRMCGAFQLPDLIGRIRSGLLNPPLSVVRYLVDGIPQALRRGPQLRDFA